MTDHSRVQLEGDRAADPDDAFVHDAGEWMRGGRRPIAFTGSWSGLGEMSVSPCATQNIQITADVDLYPLGCATVSRRTRRRAAADLELRVSRTDRSRPEQERGSRRLCVRAQRLARRTPP